MSSNSYDTRNIELSCPSVFPRPYKSNKGNDAPDKVFVPCWQTYYLVKRANEMRYILPSAALCKLAQLQWRPWKVRWKINHKSNCQTSLLPLLKPLAKAPESYSLLKLYVYKPSPVAQLVSAWYLYDSIHRYITVEVMPRSRVRASPGELFSYKFENNTFTHSYKRPQLELRKAETSDVPVL